MAFLINGKLEERTLLHYVPHGINAEMFHPIPDNDKVLKTFRENFLKKSEQFKFIILFNSRNVKRKQVSNIMLAYRTFCDNLPKEEADTCLLLMHTDIQCDAGTNLMAVKEAFCPKYNVMFSPGKISPEDMCRIYNLADVTINISSNEGFGLSVAESLMCGTPVIVNVTGGLQDQIGQTDDKGKPLKFSRNFGSNNIGKYKNHGVWAKPIWPVTRDVQGSIPTPYIFDDLSRWEDAAEALMYWYVMPKEKRAECGLKGREWCLGEGGLNSKNMCDQFTKCVTHLLENWKPKKQFGVFTKEDYVGHLMPEGDMGFEIPTIDKEKLLKEVAATVEKL